MNLLRLISWPYLRKHLLRTCLTTAAIVLGSAVFVGMHTANQTVMFAFSQTVDRIAGKAQLQITAGDTGFVEDVLEKAQSAATVKVAVPIIEAVVDTNLRTEGKLLVLGVDMTGDQSMREYEFEANDETVVEDPLIFLAQPDSILLSKDFATRNQIAAGSGITLGTAEGNRTFKVRGLMKSSGLATAFGGNLAVMDIFAAQKMFGRGRTFDRIEIATKPGVTIEACKAELTTLLGPAFTIQPPSNRSQQFETMLAGYGMIVNISSAFAFFVGMFIIYNSFALAVTQRRSEIGILRALGATRAQISALFLGESAALGVVGSLLGMAVGVLAARAIAANVGELIANFAGVAQQAERIATDTRVLLLAFSIGVVTSLLAAMVPARQAAGVDPVQALQKGRHQTLRAGEQRLRIVMASIAATVALASLAVGGSPAVAYVGCAVTVLVPLLIGPSLSLAMAKMIRPFWQWVRPVEGALAADSLIQAPRRTSATVAALMLSLALIVAFSGMARASFESLVDWMRTTLNPDLFVLPSPNLDVQTTRFPAAMGPEIAGIAGVQRIQTLRNARVTYRGAAVMVVAIEMSSVAQTDTREPLEGNRLEMYRRAATGDGVLISGTFAQLQHLRVGDPLELETPNGPLRKPVAGVVLDYSDQQGSILMDRSLFVSHWRDDTVNAFRVYAVPGADVSALRTAIIERYAGRRQVFVLSNTEVKDYVLRIIDQWFGLTTVQIALGVLIAILGVVNTLTVSIADRRRELGVLRAVGGLNSQVRRTIWMEAVGIGTMGLALGCALGGIALYFMLQIVRQDAGMQLAYRFPLSTVLALIPIILGAAFVASISPAESAVRGSLVEALEYE